MHELAADARLYVVEQRAGRRSEPDDYWSQLSLFCLTQPEDKAPLVSELSDRFRLYLQNPETQSGTGLAQGTDVVQVSSCRKEMK